MPLSCRYLRFLSSSRDHGSRRFLLRSFHPKKCKLLPTVVRTGTFTSFTFYPSNRFSPLVFKLVYLVALSSSSLILARRHTATMSVPLSRFWAELTNVLPEIAAAQYVAIDFEMTGIEPRNALPLQRPTMDQLYKRAKEAAETFNVMQFGLTCISYKEAAISGKDGGANGVFYLKSYNFNVSPMFDTHSNGGAFLARVLDRTLTLSYKTLMFLSKNRIRIEDAYDGGIPYLSRAEEAQIIAELSGLQQHSKAEHIDIKKTQQETKQFCADVTDKIRFWESDPSSVSWCQT